MDRSCSQNPIEERDLKEGLGLGENNIRMELEEIGINTKNSVDSAHVRDCWRALVNVALNFRVP